MVIDYLLTLIPVITSTTGIVIISKIAIGVVKHVAKKKNEEAEELRRQNQLLKEQNLELKNTLARIEDKVTSNVRNQEIIIKEVGMVVDEQRKANEENAKIVDSGTTIRNELRTLLEAKKE